MLTRKVSIDLVLLPAEKMPLAFKKNEEVQRIKQELSNHIIKVTIKRIVVAFQLGYIPRLDGDFILGDVNMIIANYIMAKVNEKEEPGIGYATDILCLFGLNTKKLLGSNPDYIASVLRKYYKAHHLRVFIKESIKFTENNEIRFKFVDSYLKDCGDGTAYRSTTGTFKFYAEVNAN